MKFGGAYFLVLQLCLSGFLPENVVFQGDYLAPPSSLKQKKTRFVPPRPTRIERFEGLVKTGSFRLPDKKITEQDASEQNLDRILRLSTHDNHIDYKTLETLFINSIRLLKENPWETKGDPEKKPFAKENLLETFFEKYFSNWELLPAIGEEKQMKRLATVIFLHLLGTEGVKGFSEEDQDRFRLSTKETPFQVPGTDLSICLEEAQLQGADLMETELKRIRLVKANLTEAQLQEADLSNADLTQAVLRRTHLEGAQFQGTILNQASLSFAQAEEADFTGAYLLEASLYNFRAPKASFKEAYLNGRTNLYQAILEGADFSRAQLQGANLSGAKLQGANLTETDLENADLEGADVKNVAFDRTNLKGTRFFRAFAMGADFRAAKVDEMTFFKQAILTGALFDRLNLKKVSFEEATLHGARFIGADLSEAILSGALLHKAVLDRTRIHKAVVHNARISPSQRSYFSPTQQAVLIVSDTVEIEQISQTGRPMMVSHEIGSQRPRRDPRPTQVRIKPGPRRPPPRGTRMMPRQLPPLPKRRPKTIDISL